MADLIALLTDFGTSDVYVGVMKAVMKRICPTAEFIDISHEVTRQSVHNGALMLRNAYTFFPEGTVFLVVVDPTVGSDRRPIIVQTDQYRFVAPDNGVLIPTLNQASSWQAYELTNPAYHLKNSSYTFHGRDIFSPAAAYAARGDVALADFGAEISSLITIPTPALTVTDSRIVGEVTHIDHFGNIITSIGPLFWQDDGKLVLIANVDEQEVSPQSVHTTVNGTTIRSIRRAYHEVSVGELLLQVDSNGYLEIAINQGSAAERLNVRLHDTIIVNLT